MNIFGKPVSDIKSDDVKGLIDNEDLESLYIDFKRDKHTKDKEGKKEFCKDISGFANAYGGYLIIGIDEEKETSKPISIVHVPEANKFYEDFLKIAKDKLDPPIPDLDGNVVPVDDAGTTKDVVIFYTPSSPLKPHMNKWDSKFYKRNPRSVDPMSTVEIKEAVIQTFELSKSIEQYVKEKIESEMRELGNLFYFSITPITMPLDQGVYNPRMCKWIEVEANRILTDYDLPFKISPSLEGYKFRDKNRSFVLTHGGHTHYAAKNEVMRIKSKSETDKREGSIDGGYYKLADDGFPILNPGKIKSYVEGLCLLLAAYVEKTGITSDVLLTLHMNKSVFALPDIDMHQQHLHERDHPSGRRKEYVLNIQHVRGAGEIGEYETTKYILDRFWNAFSLKECRLF